MSPYGLNGLPLYNTRYNTGLNPLWASPQSASSRQDSPWNNIWLDSFPRRPYSALPYYSATDGFAPRYAPFAQPPLSQYAYPYSRRRQPHPVSTPPAKLYRNRYGSARYAQPINSGKGGRWYGLHGSDSSPCVTEFCGLLPPQREIAGTTPALALDGLWQTQSGEMLGIKNNHFLWSNGGSRHLTGTIRALHGSLIANVDGKGNRVMQYRYRIENNRLFTQDSHGRVRVFIRLPVNK